MGDSLVSASGQSDITSPVAYDPAAQAHQEIFTSRPCALPPALLAQQIAYNFPGQRPMPTPPPFTSPSVTTTAIPETIPTSSRKPYRKTPISELSDQEKEARQRLVASSEHDRKIFLEFLKEPNHGGLTPQRVATLQRKFKHHTMSSYPASVVGIEANKKGRREGLAEIAHLKAQRASGPQEGVNDHGGVSGVESKGVSTPESPQVDAAENTEGGEGNGESEDTSTKSKSQERTSDGITSSYSLNGKDCTKEELDVDMSRNPRTAPPQQPGIAAPMPVTQYSQAHQPALPRQYSQDHRPAVPQQYPQDPRAAPPQQYSQQMHPQQMHSQQMHSQQMHSQMPSHQIQGQQMPGHQMPSQQIPGQQIPGQQMPGQQMPGQQMRGQSPWAPFYQGHYFQGYPPRRPPWP